MKWIRQNRLILADINRIEPNGSIRRHSTGISISLILCLLKHKWPPRDKAAQHRATRLVAQLPRAERGPGPPCTAAGALAEACVPAADDPDRTRGPPGHRSGGGGLSAAPCGPMEPRSPGVRAAPPLPREAAPGPGMLPHGKRGKERAACGF